MYCLFLSQPRHEVSPQHWSLFTFLTWVLVLARVLVLCRVLVLTRVQVRCRVLVLTWALLYICVL